MIYSGLNGSLVIFYISSWPRRTNRGAVGLISKLLSEMGCFKFM
jgi:hypothetical protein